MPKKIILKNGARVVLEPYKGTEAVTVLVLFKVGSRHETKDINGVSHFIEHMMFKGTGKRPNTQLITRELDGLGAEYNAFTAKDHTGYYIKINSEHKEVALDMLFDMLFNSKFDEKELNRERKVILEEIHMYKDNPMMHIEDMFEQTLFGDCPLGWSIAGDPESMGKINRAKMLAYRDAYYLPQNMVIGIAGKIDESVMKIVEKYFGSLPSSVKKISEISARGGSAFCARGRIRSFGGGGKKTVFTPGAPKVAVEYKDSEQVQLALGFPAYSWWDKRLAALRLMTNILGGTMSSRLFIAVRERRGLAYSIHAGIDHYEDIGVLTVRAGLDKSRIELAMKTILDELKKMAKDGVTAAELRRAKENIRGRIILSLEDSEALAAWYAKEELDKHEIKTPADKLKEIAAVTMAEVKAVAADVIKNNKVALAIIGPYKDVKPFRKILRDNF